MSDEMSLKTITEVNMKLNMFRLTTVLRNLRHATHNDFKSLLFA